MAGIKLRAQFHEKIEAHNEFGEMCQWNKYLAIKPIITNFLS